MKIPENPYCAAEEPVLEEPVTIDSIEAIRSLSSMQEGIFFHTLLTSDWVQSSGSVGVRLCRTSEEVVEHAGLLLQRTVNERGMPMLAELLIEEYINGPEFFQILFFQILVGRRMAGNPFPAAVS